MITGRRLPAVLSRVRAHVQQWPAPAMERYKSDPFLTLIGCLLSLRTQDATTHAACERLFAAARTPEAMRALPLDRLTRAIYPVGFYRTKAATIHALCEALLARHDGRVPDDLEALLRLPGVGRKTANLVVTLAYGKPGICVDTHVHRIANRWGYVRTASPDETEQALRRRLPRRFWLTLNDWLVTFGQHTCRPTSPHCSRCPIARWCPRIGVTRAR